MQYQQPFFKSTDKKIEDQYGLGIYFLEKKEYEKAYENFVLAADNGHISACFNLYLMICSGITKYFDIDLAVTYLKKAADSEHPTAKSILQYLELADNASIGYDNIINTCKKIGVPPSGLQPWMMLITTRFTKAICERFNAKNEFLKISLYFMDNNYISKAYFGNFYIYFGSYYDGIKHHNAGGAGSQIYEYLIKLISTLDEIGYPKEYIEAAHHTIIGYVLNDSELNERPTNLIGLEDFLKIYNDPKLHERHKDPFGF